MIHRYPLQWPPTWPHYKGSKSDGGFQVSYEKAEQDLQHELELLRVETAWLSTGQPLRMDGRPRRNEQPASAAVVLYFIRNGEQLCIPCDRFYSIKANIRAIGLTIEAIRRMERYGTSQMVEAALSGFTALPANAGQHTTTRRSWWEVLGVAQDAPAEVVLAAYKALVKSRHPDAGGSEAAWQELREALKESGVTQ